MESLAEAWICFDVTVAPEVVELTLKPIVALSGVSEELTVVVP